MPKFRVSLQNAWRAGFGRHLLVINTVSSGGFFVLGDAIQQRLEMTQNLEQRFDLKRNCRLGVVGLTQGPPTHYWYLHLDKFLPGKSYGVIMKKILVDQMIGASRKDRCRGRLSVSTVATTSSLTTTSRLSSMETLRTSKYLSMIMRFYSSQGKSIKIHFHGQRNLSVQ